MDAWSVRLPGLWTLGRLDSGRLDSGRWTLGLWTLCLWTRSRLDCGRTDFGRLDSGRLGAWIIGQLLITTRFQPRRYYNWKLWFCNLLKRMYICTCSFITEKRPFNGWMTATFVAKLTQNLWKRGWLQLLLEKKRNTVNKKWIQLFSGLNAVTCKVKNVFQEQLLFESPRFFMTCYFVKIFLVHHLIIAAICYFRFKQLIGWKHFLVNYHWSKSKEEQMLYLRSFEIAADVLNQ